MKWAPFKWCQVIFFPFLKPKYIISTYVSVSLPRFFILFQRSVWAAKKEWRVHRARAACFPHGSTVAFDFGLCGFYLTLLFSSFHAHNQASLQTHTAHRCCSWSSHLHPGEGTHVWAKQTCTCVCANSIGSEDFLEISCFFFPPPLSGREGKELKNQFFLSLFFKTLIGSLMTQCGNVSH